MSRCILCGAEILEGVSSSSFKVRVDCVGFGCVLERVRDFHHGCVSRPEGIDEAARAEVLSYLERLAEVQGIDPDLRRRNLARFRKLFGATRRARDAKRRVHGHARDEPDAPAKLGHDHSGDRVRRGHSVRRSKNHG